MTEPIATTGAALASVQLPDGRVVQVPGGSNEEIAANLRVMQAREKGEARGKEAGWMPMVDNIVRQFAGGASFGGSDEASAALDASTHGMLGRGSDAPNFNQRYSENVAAERGHDEAFRQAHPWIAGGANVAGTVAGAAAALPRALFSTAASIPANVAKTASVGGGLGGTQGFLEGEGGLDQRLASALKGGMYGTAAGIALPAGGVAARMGAETGPGRWISNNLVDPVMDRVVNPAVDAVANAGSGISQHVGDAVHRLLGGSSPQTMARSGGAAEGGAEAADYAAQRAAADRLATALQRSKQTAEGAEGRLGELGDQATLADTSKAALRLARGVNTLEGETSDLAEDVLKRRDMGAGQRLVKALEGNEPPPSSYDLMGRDQGFDQYRRQVGREAYDAADAAGLNQSERLKNLYSNPEVSGAIDQVLAKNQAARVGSGEPPASPIDIMHQVKQVIESRGQTETGRGAPWQQAYRDLAGNYTGALKEANPALAEADTRYRAAASLPEYYQMGHSLLTKGGSENAIETSAAALDKKLPLADALQQTAARAGATNAGREASLEGITGARGFARRIEQSQPVQDKIRSLYTQPGHAESIINQANTEGVFANTSNQLRGGSQTAEKLADTEGLGGRLTLTGEGKIYERLTEGAKKFLERIAEPNEAVRNEIGRTMLNTNPEANKRALALAAELLKRRAHGNAAPAGAASSLGNQFGRE